MLVNIFFNIFWLIFSFFNVNFCSVFFNVLFVMKCVLFFNFLLVLVKWIKLVCWFFLLVMCIIKCWCFILFIKWVMLGLFLKVVLYSFCCVILFFFYRKRRIVYCLGVIFILFWWKFWFSFWLMVVDILLFNMVNINWILKLNCFIMELLFK